MKKDTSKQHTNILNLLIVCVGDGGVAVLPIAAPPLLSGIRLWEAGCLPSWTGDHSSGQVEYLQEQCCVEAWLDSRLHDAGPVANVQTGSAWTA